MIQKLFRNYRKLFNILKKVKLLINILQVYLLKLLNPIRKSSCSKYTKRCEYDINNKNFKYTLLGQNTPTCCLTHLYEITRDITKILNRENIDYFIMYGTLLGQVRHNQSFIPWDTDVDIVVMRKDREEVISLIKNEFSNIYNIVEHDKILKINYSKSNHLHADIYFFEEVDNILIDKLNDYWIKEKINKNDVFPLFFSKLYDLDVKVPNNSINILKTTYGHDCLEKAYKKYAYKTEVSSTFESGKINDKI